MALEALRFGEENLERLTAGISERVLDQPVAARDRIQLEHEIADLVNQYHDQSTKLIALYQDQDGEREGELRSITNDLADFGSRLRDLKEYHRKYPDQVVDNLELAYRRKAPGDNDMGSFQVDSMFTGEEAYGRYLDLVIYHELYLNLPGAGGGRRVNYQTYVSSVFDQFTPPNGLKRADKFSDKYQDYITQLAQYLQSFLKKTKPMQDNDALLAQWDKEFEEIWSKHEMPGWNKDSSEPNDTGGPVTEGSGTGVWCAACQKEFGNQSVYDNHLSGKKHLRAAKAREETANGAGILNGANGSNGTTHKTSDHAAKEKSTAVKEFRIAKLAAAMQTQRHDTVTNIDRKAGLTEKERQAELEAMYAETIGGNVGVSQDGGRDEASDDDGDDKIYNPLKLPLAWDGKPIPYWLYKLHGLGQEFKCEICGNYIYMGRRAYERHFNEPRHVWGLKALGIPGSSLFHQISDIEPAMRLWEKIRSDRKDKTSKDKDIVMCEDSEGNVMPESIYNDLAKQGMV